MVFYHLPAWVPLLESRFVRNGYLMVDLFFVLSGFVIGSAYARSLTTPKDLLRFQWLRIGRIYPLHALFLLVFLGIEVLRYLAAGKTGAGAIRVQAFSVNSPEALVQQIFLTQAIGPTGNAFTFNRPAWSISVEFYVYVLFGLLALFTKGRRNLCFGLVAGLSVLVLATGNSHGWEEFLRGTAGFFLGTLIADACRTQRLPRFPAALGLGAAAAFAAFLALKDGHALDVGVYFFAALLMACLVGGETSALNRALRRPALAYLGKISYSIYMCHAFVIWVATTVLKYVLARPERLDAEGSWITQLSALDAALAIPLIVGSTLALAALLYRYVEQPLRVKSRAFVKAPAR